jgi:hypothetical protein
MLSPSNSQRPDGSSRVETVPIFDCIQAATSSSTHATAFREIRR